MALSNYQFAFNGLTIGAGTPFQIIDVDGLETTPDLRVQDAPRGYSDGYFTGRDFYAGRTMTLTLNIFAGNSNSAQDNWNLLKAAWVPVQALTSANGLLQFALATSVQDPTVGLSKRMTARVRKRIAKIDPEFTYGFIRAQVEFFAPDYRYYSDTEFSGTMSPVPPQTNLGRLYNRTYNLSYLTPYANSVATITNTEGTAAAGPIITIQGPCTRPQITNLSTCQYIQLSNTLSATDVVVIDLIQNTITLNGSNARNFMTGGSQFFTCAAGATTQIYFTAATISGTFSVTYRKAFV